MRNSVYLINLKNLRYNYLLAKEKTNGKLFAVVKANAYGHGVEKVCQTLKDIVDGFAVAFVEEAIKLRNIGIEKDILVLEGFFDKEDLEKIIQNNLLTAIHNDYQIKLINNIEQTLTLFLKINSGMNRLGFDYNKSKLVISKLKKHNLILTSHFACSDSNIIKTKYIYQKFKKKFHNFQISISNSAAFFSNLSSDFDRIGLALYGINPLKDSKSNLKPVSSLFAQIIAINTVNKNEFIGYGEEFKAPKDMTIAIVSIGYADGYPRNIKNGTEVFVKNQKAFTVGKTSMDMISIDISDIKNVKIGDIVELWGENIDINKVASNSNTIPYEILCNIKRVNFKYIQ